MEVTLETERLILRMFRESDFDAYADSVADLEVVRYLGDGKPKDQLEAWRNMAMVIGHWHLRGFGFWAVEEKSTGDLVGRIGCWHPGGWPAFEVGWILRRESWGKGYATEGGRAAMDWAFRKLGRDKVSSVILKGNERSIHVAEKLGESYERTEELGGNEALIYSITREDWEARQA